MNTDINFSGPVLATQYLPRPRLKKILDQATRFKLVYVIAGVGYGKTQAVRSYFEDKKDATMLWMQITESDNIVSRFWEDFTHVVSPDNSELLGKLREFGFPETLDRFKKFVELIRETDIYSSKTFFVLDDFHLLVSKEVLLFVEHFVHLHPPDMCVLILSRKEPEINAVSLFAKGNGSELTEDELRFTAEETSALFKQCETPCSARNISQLTEATKGWAMALNMLCLTMKKIPNNFKYALDFVMQNIFKSIASEAWDNFPQHIQKTIVKLSLLSDLPVISPQEIFDDAECLRSTPELASFIRFDSFTNDIRIHSLYLEFLKDKLYILSYEEKKETYRLAAKWCVKHDFYLSAICYYAKSQQFERIIQTLLSYPLKLSRDASEYILHILENPELTNSYADNSDVLFLKSFFIPLLLIGADRYEEAQARSLKVIREWEHVDTPSSALFLYTGYSNLAYIDMYTCTATHKYDAPTYLKKSLEYFQRVSLPSANVSETFINADLRCFACLVGEGADFIAFEQFLEAMNQTELLIEKTRHNIYAGYEDLVACEVAFFKNQPGPARNHAHKAILKASENQQHSIVAMAEKYLLCIAMQEGNTSLVKELLKQLQAHLQNPNFRNRQLYYDLYTGAFFINIGLLEKVPEWFIMDNHEMTTDVHIPTGELFVRVLYYIAAKKYQQALTILCSSYPREPYERFLFGELRFSLLTAVARSRTGDTAGAMVAFKKAYELSFQGVFEMAFIELGKELHPLVAAALSQADCGIRKEWLKDMDRRASIYAKKVAVVASAFKPNTTETASLSTRERELLLDLYHGLSREEIAKNRYLSINTVKKTLQSIYIKLNANNNVDAIRVALEKKILE